MPDTSYGILTGPPNITPIDQKSVFATIGGFRRGVFTELWLRNCFFPRGSPPKTCLSDIKTRKNAFF